MMFIDDNVFFFRASIIIVMFIVIVLELDYTHRKDMRQCRDSIKQCQNTIEDIKNSQRDFPWLYLKKLTDYLEDNNNKK